MPQPTISGSGIERKKSKSFPDVSNIELMREIDSGYKETSSADFDSEQSGEDRLVEKLIQRLFRRNGPAKATSFLASCLEEIHDSYHRQDKSTSLADDERNTSLADGEKVLEEWQNGSENSSTETMAEEDEFQKEYVQSVDFVTENTSDSFDPLEDITYKYYVEKRRADRLQEINALRQIICKNRKLPANDNNGICSTNLKLLTQENRIMKEKCKILEKFNADLKQKLKWLMQCNREFKADSQQLVWDKMELNREKGVIRAKLDELGKQVQKRNTYIQRLMSCGEIWQKSREAYNLKRQSYRKHAMPDIRLYTPSEDGSGPCEICPTDKIIQQLVDEENEYEFNFRTPFQNSSVSNSDLIRFASINPDPQVGFINCHTRTENEDTANFKIGLPISATSPSCSKSSFKSNSSLTSKQLEPIAESEGESPWKEKHDGDKVSVWSQIAHEEPLRSGLSNSNLSHLDEEETETMDTASTVSEYIPVYKCSNDDVLHQQSSRNSRFRQIGRLFSCAGGR